MVFICFHHFQERQVASMAAISNRNCLWECLSFGCRLSHSLSHWRWCTSSSRFLQWVWASSIFKWLSSSSCSLGQHQLTLCTYEQLYSWPEHTSYVCTCRWCDDSSPHWGDHYWFGFRNIDEILDFWTFGNVKCWSEGWESCRRFVGDPEWLGLIRTMAGARVQQWSWCDCKNGVEASRLCRLDVPHPKVTWHEGLEDFFDDKRIFSFFCLALASLSLWISDKVVLQSTPKRSPWVRPCNALSKMLNSHVQGDAWIPEGVWSKAWSGARNGEDLCYFQAEWTTCCVSWWLSWSLFWSLAWWQLHHGHCILSRRHGDGEELWQHCTLRDVAWDNSLEDVQCFHSALPGLFGGFKNPQDKNDSSCPVITIQQKGEKGMSTSSTFWVISLYEWYVVQGRQRVVFMSRVVLLWSFGMFSVKMFCCRCLYCIDVYIDILYI